jgi:hypothetical protein
VQLTTGETDQRLGGCAHFSAGLVRQRLNPWRPMVSAYAIAKITFPKFFPSDNNR